VVILLPAPELPGPDATRAIRQIGPDCYEVPRRTFDRLLADRPLATGQARLLPEVHDGAPAGFRLMSVARDGLLARFGLRNGDLLQDMNGVPLVSPENALVAYARLRATGRLLVGLERNGRRLTKEVRVVE
jgi:general secretion pathway protein C